MTKRYAKKKSKHDRVGTRMDIPSPSHPARPEEKEGSGRPWYVLLALVMLVTLASYSNGLRNQFVFDDNLLIRNNPAVRGIEKIPGLLGAGKKKGSVPAPENDLLCRGLHPESEALETPGKL